MKRNRVRLLALALLLGCFAPCALARAEGLEGYVGIWVAEDVVAEIRREDDEVAVECRIVFMEGDDDSYVWTYNGWYDAGEDCLQCMNVVRERQHYNRLWDVLEQSDWSLNDMDFARFDLTESGLRFSVDALDAPLDFVRMEKAGMGERNAALAYLGEWRNELATLWVEDRGAAYLFTVYAPMSDGSTHTWTYTCRYDAAGMRMASVDVSPRRVITPTAEGGTIEEEVGRVTSEAVFTLEDANLLVWTDVTDGDGEDMAFERVAH